MIDFKHEYESCRMLIEHELECCFKQNEPQKGLFEAMRYSLLAGGKRVRPVLVLKFCEACGGDIKKAMPFALGIEMLHTYSLIHDDLPCMDNDELRRGKPSNHIVFGEYTAVLAGDALLTEAFSTLLSADLSADACVSAGRVLADAAGCMGMCGGQFLDMEGEGWDLNAEAISAIHERKTAALIRAAARLGVIAGAGTEDQFEAATEYADAIGLAFQLRDDILDILSTAERLGKSVGKDFKSGKSTFASVYGADECERMILEKTEGAKSAIASSFNNTDFLNCLADNLAERLY